MLGERKSKAGSFMFAADLAVDLAKGSHRLRNLLGRHSDTGIRYRQDQIAISSECRKAHSAAVRRELDGIGKEIEHNLPKAERVNPNKRDVVVEELGKANMRFSRLRFDKLHAGFQRRGEIHVLLMELNFPGFQFR